MTEPDRRSEAIERLGELPVEIIDAIDEHDPYHLGNATPEAILVDLLPRADREDDTKVAEFFNDLARSAPEVYRYRKADGTLMWMVRQSWQTYSSSVVIDNPKTATKRWGR